MAGLQDIWAIRSMLMVSRQVRRPMRAEARAASHPAWPPPTTTMSYSSIMRAEPGEKERGAEEHLPPRMIPENRPYFAFSTKRDSRMSVTFTSPG